jgi:hypothetical protein
VKVDTFRPRTWEECRDLACYLGGPNPALPPTRFTAKPIMTLLPNPWAAPMHWRNTKPISWIRSPLPAGCASSWCEQQPESFNDRGKKDVRGTYGLMGREMIGWLTHLQHTRGKNVFFVGILENLKDEFNVTSWELQIEGSKTGKELPGIVDQIATMQFVDFGDGKPVRALICTQPNPWNYPAKDRSGRLDQIEEPHLGKMAGQADRQGPRHAVDHTIPPQTKQTSNHQAA